jgi:hypothetical protein
MSKVKSFFFYGGFVHHGAGAHDDVVVLGESSRKSRACCSINLSSFFLRRALKIYHNFSSVVPGV